MPRTTSITIGEQLDDFVSKLIDSGRYSSTSEVIRSALRLLEQQESKTEALKKAIYAGEQSGESSLTLREIAAKKKRERNV
ncbi:type II toxin-antitoxin system ParD family antitoxin [Pectobacterium brasiliense]|jgi:antitoxin ParD1/3/4|uniref:Antitoxin ParD n=9 Tax=Pectobacterium TaxID=122277 RepID=A0A093UZK9_9GAMM|nr:MULTISPECIES: type II toxin-antitoxin system ParD family antitoxin [Pectobacterium]ACT11186.1 putative addiction module antidote protein, CopG/Arc/MetJ family [Pectobacterium carotovorum subsp. carotovorum PC1]ACX85984.1 putative addiction module antidote protein, CopG/Arc/MetJ family [Pectobacterium parmentieri WPP163]AOR60723.1 antitoxin [Pectobacterium parmentieri]APS28303.1 antitoxin [Pectobacterium brasiliense]ATV44843.1 type II toxin-antitoxin system ParD family antitoxin [Pectobacter